MEILEGITEEKLTGEDSINGTTHGKDEAIEDVINECFLSRLHRLSQVRQ